MERNKNIEAHTDDLLKQAHGLLDELDDVRRKYGLVGEMPPQANGSWQRGDAGQGSVQKEKAAVALKEEEVIMTDQDQQKEKETQEAKAPAEDQPVYYDADGNPVPPVVYYDAQGRPVVPAFAAQPVPAQPEEQYETLPDGTRVRVVYQEPESKRTSAAKQPASPKQQAAPVKQDKPSPKQEAAASMRVIYEAPDAHLANKAPKQQEDEDHTQPSVPAAQQPSAPLEKTAPPSSSSLADLFAEAGQDTGNQKKKQKKEKGRFGDGWLPWRGDTAAEKVRRTVFLLALATLLVCLPFLGYRLYEGWYNDYFTKQLAGQVQTGLDESAWEDIRARHPGVNFPEGMNPAYADLYAANQDMVGWLKIENTKYINFPIVQTTDNDIYLKRDFYGRKTDYGNPFLDFRNNAKELDRNTIIFGHHMRSGDQEFSELTDYLTIDGFKRHPVIDFSTLYADYKWKVYAVFLTNSKAQHDNGYVFNYIFTNLESDDKFMEYVSEIDQRKLYSTGVDIKPTDKILTLSTCNYDWDAQRLVVVARLVREGENPSVDTSLAKKNENPRYPQIYYDQKGITNPYRDAKKWEA